MKSLAERFFTEAEARQVREAVAAAEASTSGEIVVMVASSSHEYPEARAALALAVAALAGLAAAKGAAPLFWWPGDPLWLFLCVGAAALVALRFLLPHAPLLWRPCIHPSRARDEVEREAVLNFYGKRLHHTRQATGVLIFISVLERRAHILADTGVSAVFPPTAWEGLTRDLCVGIRAGRAAEATVTAVKRLGAMLAESFPIQPDDENELADLVIVRPREQVRVGEELVIR